MKKNIDLKNILDSCADKLKAFDKEVKVQGLERVIQSAIHQSIPGSRKEVKLIEIGAKSVNNSEEGFIDIVIGTHGIELKVIEFPRYPSSVSDALYDIGQISADYWRLKNAKKLESFEIIILLHGDLVKTIKSPTYIYREFHNRMYVDYSTALNFGEFRKERYYNNEWKITRQRQLSIIKELGFNLPCDSDTPKAIQKFVYEDYALLSIKSVRQ